MHKTARASFFSCSSLCGGWGQECSVGMSPQNPSHAKVVGLNVASDARRGPLREIQFYTADATTGFLWSNFLRRLMPSWSRKPMRLVTCNPCWNPAPTSHTHPAPLKSSVVSQSRARRADRCRSSWQSVVTLPFSMGKRCSFAGLLLLFNFNLLSHTAAIFLIRLRLVNFKGYRCLSSHSALIWWSLKAERFLMVSSWGEEKNKSGCSFAKIVPSSLFQIQASLRKETGCTSSIKNRLQSRVRIGFSCPKLSTLPD